MVRTLINEYNVDINSSAAAPIIGAVSLEEDSILKELVEKGASLDGEIGIKAVRAAREVNSQSMLALLGRHGVNMSPSCHRCNLPSFDRLIAKCGCPLGGGEGMSLVASILALCRNLLRESSSRPPKLYISAFPGRLGLQNLVIGKYTGCVGYRIHIYKTGLLQDQQARILNTVTAGERDVR